jgi:hypothetical protein
MAEYEESCRGAIAYLLEEMKRNRQYPVMTEQKFGRYDHMNEETGEESLEDSMANTKEAVLKFGGEEDISIRGIIDRVDYDANTDSYIVVDYKTGKIENKRKLRKNGRDDLIQDRIYAMVLEVLHPDKTVTASRFIFTSYGNQEIYEKMTPESKAAFKKRFLEDIKKIREKKDIACKGNQDDFPDCMDTCSYCGFKELCAAYDEMASISVEEKD